MTKSGSDVSALACFNQIKQSPQISPRSWWKGHPNNPHYRCHSKCHGNPQLHPTRVVRRVREHCSQGQQSVSLFSYRIIWWLSTTSNEDKIEANLVPGGCWLGSALKSMSMVEAEEERDDEMDEPRMAWDKSSKAFASGGLGSEGRSGATANCCGLITAFNSVADRWSFPKRKQRRNRSRGGMGWGG